MAIIAGLGELSRLPSEVLLNIAYNLVAQTPKGPPSELVPLLQVSKALNSILSADSLKARIFKLKFDDGAVRRRSFNPHNKDLAEQLVHACSMLRAVKSGNIYSEEVEMHLTTAYVLMLDNDGKNYAQLEWAGIHSYVNSYVRRRLWEGREQNEGWPVDSQANACALWLMWMTTSREKLLAETLDQREQLVILILPFVVLPQRYAMAEAPPNHFHLPLSPSNPLHQPPLAIPIPSYRPQSSLYPHYLEPARKESQVYFRARPDLGPPLVTVAAKLLFVARREIVPIRMPHTPPPGLTSADYAELNKSKAAELPRGARWDWEAGVSRAVNLSEGDKGLPIEIGESMKWDTEWWRRRLCWDCMAPRPRFAPGLTFTPGSMRGVWQGRIYIPQGNLWNQLLHSPIYPGVRNESGLFTESSIGLVMQPVFFNIEEHHRICECPSSKHLASCGSDRASSENGFSPSSTPTPSATTLVESDGCGIIPVPAPRRVLLAGRIDANDQVDFGNDIDDNGNPIPDQPEVANTDPEDEDDGLSHPSIAANDASMLVPNRIDYSMGNAWFPGALGGVSFVKRKAYEVVDGPSGSQRKRQRRDEVVFAADYERPRLDEKGGCMSFEASSSSSPPPLQAPSKGYVYETYDPTLPSSHDSTTCMRCAEWEDARMQERNRARVKAEGILEGYMRDFSSQSGRKGTDAEELKMEELDVRGFGFDFETVVGRSAVEDEEMRTASSGSSPSDEDEEYSDDDDESPVAILGDDHPSGQPAIYDKHGNLFAEATRRVFDRERVGVAEGCCGGVRDIVLTGETDPQHAVWHQQQYTMYGRVRPWDGLIGILRVGSVPSTNYLFVCGYLVGENNFVGEWRVAAADPLRPAWGSAFVMSRRK